MKRNTKQQTKRRAPDSVVIGVRIEREIADRLRVIAAEEDRSLSGVMRKIVKDRLAEPDPDLPTAA